MESVSLPGIRRLGNYFCLFLIATGCLFVGACKNSNNPPSSNSGGSGPRSMPATAPTPAPTPASDLGEQVMKPMKDLVTQIQGDLPDGSKNADVIKNIAKVRALIAVAEVTTPDTDHYKAEVELVGADAASAKYVSLLVVVDVSFSELSATVQKAGSQVCGLPCQDLLSQIGSLEQVGHSTFRD